MSGLIKKFYAPLLFDCLFALCGTFGLIGIVLDAGRAYPAIAAAAQPLAKGAALAGTLVAAGLLAIVMARFDQKHADDFMFQTLTKSAFIAMFIAFFALAFWNMVITPQLGGVSSFATLGVLIVSWSLGYFYTRVWGTKS